MINPKSNLIIVLGAIPSLDNQDITNELLKKAKEGVKIVLLSTLEDTKLADKVQMFCKYEAGSEEGVVAILAKYLVQDETINDELKEYFSELDEGYLSAETNIGEEEFEDIFDMYKSASFTQLIVGEDLINHTRAANIKLFLEIIKKHTNIEVSSLNELSLNEDIKTPSEVEELSSFDGTVVINYKTEDEDKLNLLVGSRQFSVAAKSGNNQKVIVDFGQAKEDRIFVIDESLKGTIALMPMRDENSSYRYKVAKIIKREANE